MEKNLWLGTGALTLGVGAAALVGGTGLAHADSPDGGSAKTSVGSSAPHTGPKATGHRAAAKVPGAVRVAPPRSALTQRPSAAIAPAKASASASPVQSLVDDTVRRLVALGGMNQETPTPARGNLWQLGLYSVARWLADTANPGGIPRMNAVVTGQPDPLTGVVTGQFVFTDRAGNPVTHYQVSVDPKLGTVVVNPNGTYTFTPLQSTILGAPDGGGTIKMKVTAINGVQRASQAIPLATSNPWGLVKPTIDVGGFPLFIAVSPDGTRVAIADAGTGTVSLINTATNKVIATIPVGTQAGGVVFDPTGTRFYAVDPIGNSVVAVSLPANSVGTPIGVGPNPFMTAIGPVGTPAAGKLYVTNFGDSGLGNTVSVVDIATKQVTTVIVGRNGAGPFGVAVSPDGTRLWVTNASADAIAIVDTTINKVIKTVPLPSGAVYVAFSPDGHQVYVTNADTTNTVTVINTADYTTAGTITVGQKPGAIAFSADGSVAYVTNQSDNTVSVINTATKTSIKTIAVGKNPLGVAASPDGKYLYVTNVFDSNVMVIPV
ncbi:YncE family protein [Mycolicibacterium sp. Dal123E01]|uniref:YncE family protein n=1 Tax=Mycolicibacterium sp. Dal123E01 TaxID=3457578 RepID=UPI00403EF5DE